MEDDKSLSEKLLQEATALIEIGDKRKGLRLINEVLTIDPDNETAWLWKSKSVVSEFYQRECLQQVLRINPDNHLAKGALSELHRRKKEETVAIIMGVLAGIGGSVLVLFLPEIVFQFILKYVFGGKGEGLFLFMIYAPLIAAGFLGAPIIGWMTGWLIYKGLTPREIASRSSIKGIMVISTILFYLIVGGIAGLSGS